MFVTCNKCDPLYLFNNQRCCGLENTTLGFHHISGNLHDSNFYSGYRSGSFDDEAFRTSYEKTEVIKNDQPDTILYPADRFFIHLLIRYPWFGIQIERCFPNYPVYPQTTYVPCLMHRFDQTQFVVC